MRKEKKKKNCLGMADGERKKKKGEKERRKKMGYKNSSLRDSISRWTLHGKSANSDLIRT